MSGISSVQSSMLVAAGSMAAHSVGMQVSAHNVANVSTDGFSPRRATYATGSGGTGAELETVRKLASPLGEADSASAPDSAKAPNDILPQSGTELSEEMPRMILAERGFQANAAVVTAADEMLGSLLNFKI